MRLLLPQLLLLSIASVAFCQEGQIAGIRIDDPLTITKCGGCHARDTNGMMTRISRLRTTPEVWQEIVKRMTRLNGVVLTEGEARSIIRYLARNNGLAPEEAQPVFFEAEHRLFRDQEDENIVPDALQHTCNYCHTIGRVLAQRRTRDDYEKLTALHMALFPYSEIMVFRPYVLPTDVSEMPITTTAAGEYDTTVNYPKPHVNPEKFPVEVAIDYLAKEQPLITPEWTAWKAVMHTPKLAGSWSVAGYQKGQGKIFGTMAVKAGPGEDEFVTTIDLHYAKTGRVLTRTGKSYVYAGYSWRGRSNTTSAVDSKDPGVTAAEVKEAMLVSRDGGKMEGRWFWGGYDEFGIDVKLSRLGSEPVVLGTDRFAIRTPSSGELKLFGANLPSSLATGDVDLGAGIRVTKITPSSANQAIVQFEASSGLPTGLRDISVRGNATIKAFAVYDKASYIKVMPDAAFARLGGTIAAKQYVQFEAIAFANGPDGKEDTDDDVAIGPVTASWSTEEFFSTVNDDDVKFVGTVDGDSGLFTPSFEGPNPLRKKQANNFGTDNYGDIWVGASARVDNGELLKARSFLVVTVPLYIHYDQPEVSK
jgi:quinohemoprotein amine dehydrogenase